MRNILGTFIICLLLLGCNQPRPENAASTKKDVKVVAPGVDVDVEPKRTPNSSGKVRVNAPGVTVDVEKKN